MSQNFHIQSRESNSNLHVRVAGAFHGDTAEALLALLHDQYNGVGRVFIDLRDLEILQPPQCHVFKARLHQLPLPPDRLFFKGEQGFQLACSGNRVLVLKKKQYRCGGTCAGCPCASRLRDRLSRGRNRPAA